MKRNMDAGLAHPLDSARRGSDRGRLRPRGDRQIAPNSHPASWFIALVFRCAASKRAMGPASLPAAMGMQRCVERWDPFERATRMILADTALTASGSTEFLGGAVLLVSRPLVGKSKKPRSPKAQSWPNPQVARALYITDSHCAA
jgi:hypothetical protein